MLNALNHYDVILNNVDTSVFKKQDVEKYPNPYETLKELTRSNSKITRETIHEFVDSLDIEQRIKDELKGISPKNYTGVYPKKG
jgi:adenylosuccinate lyase